MFPPTRDAALARLVDFIPRAGAAYAKNRNVDAPGQDNVSRLSPYLRHRILSEDEVLRATLDAHGAHGAEKFIQEVYWRTYWKGWLEQRPSVWTTYRAGLAQAMNDVQTQGGLRSGWKDACTGNTGIDAFDHWAHELADTGYLHNHARMSFASIWVFTLRLPWELGADFFLRHLIDGDNASNTLGWRWVAGIQTQGKTYLADPSAIHHCTDGRFRPQGLATWAAPVDGMPNPDATGVPTSGAVPSGKIGLLITEDDLSPDWLLDHIAPTAIAAYDGTAHRSPLTVADHVGDFVQGALDDLETRIGPFKRPETIDAIDTWARANDIDAIVVSYPPVGGTADALANLETPLIKRIRPYDTAAWPHATAGFFKFKKQIPKLLKRYN